MALRSVTLPQGTFESGEIFAVVSRCGCGNPDSHSRIPVIVREDVQTNVRDEIDAARHVPSLYYRVIETKFRSEPCPTPRAIETQGDNGLIARIDGANIPQIELEREETLWELLVALAVAIREWLKEEWRKG